MHSRAFWVSSLLLFSLARAEEPKMAPIWKVSDDDSTVYLAGSVHLLREKDMPLPAAFDKVYAEAEELVFEIDMAALSDPAMAVTLRKLGTLPEGERLADKISPETMAKLRVYLKKREMATGLFDTLTPGMVYLMMGSIEASRSGAKAHLGLESVYYAKSVTDKKSSRGLETAAFQMSRFNDFEPELIEKLLNELLESADEARETFDAIIAAWRTGDEAELSRLIVDQTAPSPKLREVLLTERNQNWIPEIEKHLATDRDVMFLVGAAHLVGDDSVVDLLREKGYEVLQLANAE